MLKSVALVLLLLWICVGVLHLALEEDDAEAPESLGEALGGVEPTAPADGTAEGTAEGRASGMGQGVGLATRAPARREPVAKPVPQKAPPLPGWLRKAARRPDGGWASIATALDALAGTRPLYTPQSQQAFLQLAQREGVPPDLRFLAIFLAMGQPGEDARVSTALFSALRRDGAVGRENVKALLAHVEEMGAGARVLLPSLIALEKRPFALWSRQKERGRFVFWHGQAQLLQVCLAVAPEDPRVTNLFLSALGRRGEAAQFARKRLLDGTPGDRRRLIALLEAAGGAAAVNGVRFLLEAGVPGSEVGHLLLPALNSKSHAVRTGAVTLLPRSGLVVADVAPLIETLFASDDQSCWLTGIEALGALGRMSGEKRAVIDLLFTAARLPNTRVRTVAVQTLLMYDGENRLIIPILADLMNDSEPRVRREAVDGLGELLAHEESARRYLQRALGDSDQTVREVAQYWLEDEDTDEGD